MNTQPSSPLPPILISGSLAYDSIMVYHDKFRDQIIPEQMHILNLVFLVPTMRREFGGCAGNIAYTLALLGSNPYIVACAGKDFSVYHDHLLRQNIDVSGIRVDLDHFTAQAFIITDEENNQITAFHPGAMQEAHQALIPSDTKAHWGIVSPNSKQAMINHLRHLNGQRVRAIFDPGQGLPMFTADELHALLPFAEAVIVNDYELKLLCEKIDCDIQGLVKQLNILIVTLGGKGCEVWQQGNCTPISALVISDIVDPTGCGDAFRSGLLHGLNHGVDWLTSAKLGNVVAGIKVSSAGAQNHRFTIDVLRKLYQQHYQEPFPLLQTIS